jgi:hypothetical protein
VAWTTVVVVTARYRAAVVGVVVVGVVVVGAAVVGVAVVVTSANWLGPLLAETVVADVVAVDTASTRAMVPVIPIMAAALNHAVRALACCAGWGLRRRLTDAPVGSIGAMYAMDAIIGAEPQGRL